MNTINNNPDSLPDLESLASESTEVDALTEGTQSEALETVEDTPMARLRDLLCVEPSAEAFEAIDTFFCETWKEHGDDVLYPLIEYAQPHFLAHEGWKEAIMFAPFLQTTHFHHFRELKELILFDRLSNDAIFAFMKEIAEEDPRVSFRDWWLPRGDDTKSRTVAFSDYDEEDFVALFQEFLREKEVSLPDDLLAEVVTSFLSEYGSNHYREGVYHLNEFDYEAEDDREQYALEDYSGFYLNRPYSPFFDKLREMREEYFQEEDLECLRKLLSVEPSREAFFAVDQFLSKIFWEEGESQELSLLISYTEAHLLDWEQPFVFSPMSGVSHLFSDTFRERCTFGSLSNDALFEFLRNLGHPQIEATDWVGLPNLVQQCRDERVYGERYSSDAQDFYRSITLPKELETEAIAVFQTFLHENGVFLPTRVIKKAFRALMFNPEGSSVFSYTEGDTDDLGYVEGEELSRLLDEIWQVLNPLK